MPLTPDRITRLREFGLSEYAARAYLALLDLGVTEARDVSSLSKVPASKIYHILEQLHEKGLVQILPEFPRKYAPVPFADHLDKIHDGHVEAAAAITRDRDALEVLFAVVGEVAGSDRGSVTMLRGRRNLTQRLREILDEAREDVLLLLTPGFAADPRGWGPSLAAAGARGARLRILVPEGVASLDVEADLRSHPGSDLPSAGLALVVDGRRALLAHLLPDDGHPHEGNDTALDLDQEGIVALLLALVEGRWAAAAPPGRAVPLEAGPSPLPAGRDRRA